MGTATNRPRASSSPYFAIHSTIIHFTQYKKTFSRQYKSYIVFCGHIYGQICRKYCFVCFPRAVYSNWVRTKGDVWRHFSRPFCHRRALRWGFWKGSWIWNAGIRNYQTFKCHVVEIKHPLGQFSEKHIIVK